MDRLEALHNVGVVHRDLKPENFLIGTGESSNTIYLIDFGLSTQFYDYIANSHVPYNETHQLVGTPLYASLYRHRGVSHSRRDDLISLVYIFLHFLRGSLPWQDVQGTAGGRNEQMAMLKEKTKPYQLCRGFPNAVATLYDYVMLLRFDERPNYLYIRLLLRECLLASATRPLDGIRQVYDWAHH